MARKSVHLPPFVPVVLVLGFLLQADRAEAQYDPDPFLTPLFTQFTHRVADRTGIARLAPGSYNSQYTACNSPQAPPWEHNCPADTTYTPTLGTGGYTAYGVGISSDPGAQGWYPDCYLTLVYRCYENGDSSFCQWEPGIACDWYFINIPRQNYGLAAALMKFGPNTYQVNGSAVRLSTLAFEGAGQPQCTPDYNGITAPCESPLVLGENVVEVPQANVTYVPDAAYEDKVTIPDSGCSAFPFRFGSASDVNTFGCFGPFAAWSTLPRPYLDSTLADPAREYRVGVGNVQMAAGQPGHVVPGQMYEWGVRFWQNGNPPINTTAAVRHIGAIVTYPPFTATCGPRLGAIDNPLCYYAVDQTPLSPPLHFDGTALPLDLDPPIPPGVLAVNETTSSSVSLSWTPGTDPGSGISGYVLTRCAGSGCSSFTRVADVAGTSYTDNSVSPSTTYKYRVASVDGVGQESTTTAQAGATTGDAAPCVPPVCGWNEILCGSYSGCQLFCYSRDWAPDPACPAM